MLFKKGGILYQSHIRAGFILIVLIAGFFNSVTTSGQTFPFKQYGLNDGLPQSLTSVPFQDSRGYLWITTRNGLARFDGIEFITYNRTNGLLSNSVNYVTEDPSGFIWVNTLKGLSKFTGERFISYPLPSDLPYLEFSVKPMVVGDSKFFLLAKQTDEHNRLIYFEDGIYKDYAIKHPALLGFEISSIAYDNKDKTLYLLDKNGLPFTYKNDLLVKIGDKKFNDLSLVENHIVFHDKNDKYVMSGNKFIDFHQDIKGLDKSFLPEKLASGLNKIEAGRNPSKWSSIPVSGSFFDKENNLWCVTENSLFRLLSTAFTEYSVADGLADHVWAIALTPKGHLFLGTFYGDLYEFDGTSFISRQDFKKLYSTPVVFYQGSITTSSGETWISTSNGVLIWNGYCFRRLQGLPEGLEICIIYEDPDDGSVFLGTDKGLYHIKGSDIDVFTEMTNSSMGVVEGIVKDEKGIYWLAGHYGVVRFDGTVFYPEKNVAGPVEYAWGIIKDDRGGIWTCSSDGLFVFSANDTTFVNGLPVNENLPANSIIKTDSSHIIVGRMKDLCIINLDKYYAGDDDYFRIIGNTLGFNGNDCQDNGFVFDKTGKLWILTSNKLICADLSRLEPAHYPPLLHLTSIECFPEDKTKENISEGSVFYGDLKKVTLYRTQNCINISYTGISTSFPEGVRYQHRLRGYDNRWSEPTAERSAFYYLLPPGNYTFELIAINSSGIKSVNPVSLDINVVPVIYQRKWFIFASSAALFLLLMFCAYVIGKRIHNRKIESARIKADLYRLQLNSVIQQFDPHFTFNVLTSVGSLIMKGEKERAYDHFMKLSSLLRTVLEDDSRQLLKPLSHEIDFVDKYCQFQKLRFRERFNYSLNVGKNVDTEQKVPKMIIQSFVENSIKHGIENKFTPGNVDITIEKKDGGTLISILDNGIGRKAAAELKTYGGGLGLKNINELVDAINKGNSSKISVNITDNYNEQNIATGTEVNIFIPENFKFEFK